jgi:hypothetical protein
MLNKIVQSAQMWTTIQEPRVASYVPNSYLLLLSALDNGWQVESIELAPSWDQHGFVYLVTLQLHSHKFSHQLILPKNDVVESLLFDGATSLFSKPVHNYRGVHA